MQSARFLPFAFRAFPTFSLVTLFALIAAITQTTTGQSVTVLYTFQGGTDGGYPSNVLADESGNLYGSAITDGDLGCFPPHGCGTVFELNSSGGFSVLHTFSDVHDGVDPNGIFVRDSEGNLYGSSAFGGEGPCSNSQLGGGCGTIFKIDPSGQETVLYKFTGGADGANPAPGLLLDKVGNLYGVAYVGGITGDGTVFRLDPTGKFELLHEFTGAPDGALPNGNLIADDEGSLYGTTIGGGNGGGCFTINTFGCGTVFKLDSTGKETVLYRFNNRGDGFNPNGPLARDVQGILYGTTSSGGSEYCFNDGGYGCGTLFKIDTAGKFSVLYRFTGGPVGINPFWGLLIDAAGNLYGTTGAGGIDALGCFTGNSYGCGAVYKRDAAGKMVSLYQFPAGPQGAFPASLSFGSNGNLYGITQGGGNTGCLGNSGCGIIYEMSH